MRSLLKRILYPLIGLILLGVTCQVAAAIPTPLPAKQAFTLHTQIKDQYLYLHWHIAEHYYLYQDRIHVIQHNKTLTIHDWPPAQIKNYAVLGKKSVYTHDLRLKLKIHVQQNITIEYQGCSSFGFCYPPQSKTIQISSPPPFC